MGIKIKICGIRNKEAILAAYNADFIGFVFYQKSPRFINAIEAKELSNFTIHSQKKVGLFVNADINLIEHITEFVGLDYIQLHGEEKPEEIKEIKKRTNLPIIKSILVNDIKDIKKSEEIECFCDMILFDTKNSNNSLPGGSGISFDWGILEGYNSSKDWILAGGLNIDNIIKAIEKTKAPIVDVSSGVEKKLGIKCEKKIKKIIGLVKND